ncbi:MAG TPA: cupredoxin domain-containing protein [Ideonella sp.]|uniref:cupredoxin domain-containing protein n=1 Tax=Ideonella sp. TaxID=1929293 RepID=UPI002C262A42|nr:cupredoxin domain-containing protein [Ideonella sp.]HSI47019.1 cupredoxin domain-containing protein [Ideonella sp.]
MSGTRRTLLIGGAALIAGVAGAQPGPRVIRIVARRFQYEPAEIALKAGEPVLLELQALDFTHGFNVPALNVRADLLPGQIVKLEIRPTAPGRVDFLCDNFCGNGHEEMSGRFIVSA